MPSSDLDDDRVDDCGRMHLPIIPPSASRHHSNMERNLASPKASKFVSKGTPARFDAAISFRFRIFISVFLAPTPLSYAQLSRTTVLPITPLRVQPHTLERGIPIFPYNLWREWSDNKKRRGRRPFWCEPGVGGDNLVLTLGEDFTSITCVR